MVRADSFLVANKEIAETPLNHSIGSVEAFKLFSDTEIEL